MPGFILSGDEACLLGELDRLRAPPRRKLVEQPRGMRLHRVFADEEAFPDLTVAEAGGHRLEDLELARRDAELFTPRFVTLKGSARRDRDRYFAHHHHFLRARQLEPEPDAERREDRRHDPAVDLQRVLDDEKAVLDQLQRQYQNAAQQAVDEDDLFHPAAGTASTTL